VGTQSIPLNVGPCIGCWDALPAAATPRGLTVIVPDSKWERLVQDLSLYERFTAELQMWTDAGEDTLRRTDELFG